MGNRESVTSSITKYVSSCGTWLLADINNWCTVPKKLRKEGYGII